jgi:hypothetical protein
MTERTRHHRGVRFGVVAAMCVVVATSGGADAKPAPTAAVEQLVRGFFAHTSEPAKLSPLLRTDAIVVVDSTKAVNASGDDAATFFGWFGVNKVGSVTVTLDDHRRAWFQIAIDAQTVDQSGDACEYNHNCTPQPFALRASGVALDGSGADAGWKLAAVIVTSNESDATLVASARQGTLPSKVAITGDATLAGAVAGWLASGKLASGAAATVMASGTAPDEHATGPATTALVARWDKLHLVAVSADAWALGDGTLGLAIVDTRWPLDKAKLVTLRLAVLATRDGDTWRWNVLDFSAR